MRQRVQQAVEELGYQPDLLAQGLRSRSTLSVGFVVGDISNPLLSEIALGAETQLRNNGYSMLLTNSENDPRLDAHHVRLFAQRRVDGLLLSTASEDYEATVAALVEAETPCVLIDRELRGLPSELQAGAVLSDHRPGMQAAVAHLLELGHRRIGVVAGPAMRFTRERIAGLRAAYEERGLEPLYEVIEGSLEARHGENAARTLLDRSDPPTALIAGANQLLVGTLSELQRRGLEVGRDISLVSCDEISVTALYQPPIAVVRRDTQQLGRRAAELLLGQLADEGQGSQQIVLPTEFLPRPSCAPPAA
jgi:LacI family transcriptional regulator